MLFRFQYELKAVTGADFKLKDLFKFKTKVLMLSVAFYFKAFLFECRLRKDTCLFSYICARTLRVIDPNFLSSSSTLCFSINALLSCPQHN